MYLAFTYQRFAFSEIDGNDLKNIPILFYYPNAQNPEVVTTTENRVDTKIDQFCRIRHVWSYESTRRFRCSTLRENIDGSQFERDRIQHNQLCHRVVC